MKRIILVALAIVVLAVGGVSVSPLSPLPGGALEGEVASGPVSDWSFAAKQRFGHLETQSPEPRTITVTCIVADGELYVGCSSCSGRYWSARLIAEPKVRYRILGKIYNVTASRVTDPDEIDRAWRARAAKYGRKAPDPIPVDFWFFRLVSL